MTGLWILLGIFLFFFILFAVPIHVIVGLSDEVSAALRILCFKIKLFPRPKRPKKKPKPPKDPKKHAQKLAKKKAKKERKDLEKAEKKAAKKAEKKAKKAAEPKKKRDIVGLVKLLLKVIGAFLRSFPKHFRIRIHDYEITVASDDAAKTAVMYGAVYALSQKLFNDLKRWKNFKIKRNASLRIDTDFLAEKTRANVKIEFILSIGGVLAMVLAAGVGFVKGAMENKTRRKELGLDEPKEKKGDSAENKADKSNKPEDTQKNAEKKSVKNKNQNG
ncbi:MAG: hypothetical protein IJ489_08535 [Clostridia bacterium]|nr:hypothetical protein [Clostridia bacterium]